MSTENDGTINFVHLHNHLDGRTCSLAGFKSSAFCFSLKCPLLRILFKVVIDIMALVIL